MNKVNTNKIVLFFVAIAMFVCAIASFIFPVATVRADDKVSSYFETKNATINVEEGDMIATVSNGATLKIKNPLVLNELEFAFKLPHGISSVKVNFTTETYLSNGNVVSEFDPTQEGFKADELKVSNEITHELVIPTNGDAWTFNGATGTNVTGENYKVYFAVSADNFVKASLESKTGDFVGSTDPEYKVKNIDKVVVYDIIFTFEVADGQTADFVLDYIDQNYNNTDGKYKQEFNDTFVAADPRVVLDASAFVFDGEKYTAKAVVGWLNTYSATAYSLTGKTTVSQSSITYQGEGNNVYVTTESEPQVCFNVAGQNKLFVINGGKTIEEYTFIVSEPNVLEEGENKAPEYVDATENQLALDTFKLALKKATYAEYDGTVANVRLGDSVAVPDMRNLIVDDYTSYANIAHTIYYKTPNASSSTTSWNIPVDKPGLYEFFVVFEDAEGNSMEGDQFYTIKDDIVTKAEYFPYVFTFEIVDDAPISVTALAQSKGYVGSTYTISSFRIEGSDYSVTYELFYNSNPNASHVDDKLNETWISIPSLANADENDVYPEGLDYDTVVATAYNGTLTFVPQKTGAYAVRCTVTSNSSGKSESKISIVKVNDTPKVVKVDTKWLQNNIWSVVFLSVGTLCLAGVVVLLFIKPKDEI